MKLKKEAKELLAISIFLLSSVSLYCGEQSFPLELKVSFPPVFCGGNICLFSRNGRNQTLDPSENAPSCNLVPLYPAVEPLCLDDALYIADSSGALYKMENRFPIEIERLEGKTIKLFSLEGKLVILQETKITVAGSGDVSLPFKAVQGFISGNSILVFGEKEGLVFTSGKISMQFAFLKGPVKDACLAGEKIVIGTDKAVFFLDKANGRIKKHFATRSEVTAVLPDGGGVAVAAKDHMVRLLDLKGNVVWQTRIEGRPMGLWPHKKGFFTAAAGGKKVILFERTKGTEIWSFSLKEGELIFPPRFAGNKMAVFAFDSTPEPALYLADLPE
jgi:hypothetical protein